MLGHLKQLNPDINGLTGRESCPLDPQISSSPRIKVSFDAESVIGADPSHQVISTQQQIWGSDTEIIPATMSGFIHASNTSIVMRAYNESMVPVLSTLALNFTLFDAFFSSVPGPTGPNRMFLHSGTSHGAATNLRNYEIEGIFGYVSAVCVLYSFNSGYPQRSFFKDLHESSLSFGVYFEDFPVVLELRDVREYLDRFHEMGDFFKHARRGELPRYSFLEPRWEDEKIWTASTQHPDHPIEMGEMLLKEVYDAIRSGPDWNSTVLIVTYDEHGGLYDHEPVPFQVFVCVCCLCVLFVFYLFFTRPFQILTAASLLFLVVFSILRVLGSVFRLLSFRLWLLLVQLCTRRRSPASFGSTQV